MNKPSHINLGHRPKISQLVVPAGVAHKSPFYYKSPSLAQGMPEKKQSSLHRIGTSFLLKQHGNHKRNRSFKEPKTDVPQPKNISTKQASHELRQRLNALDNRLTQIRVSYESRKNVLAGLQNKNKSKPNLPPGIYGKQNNSQRPLLRKKLTLQENSEKSGSNDDTRLLIQSPKRFTIGQGYPKAADKDDRSANENKEKKEFTTNKSSFLNYVTQYQQPKNISIPQVSSEASLTRPLTTKNSDIVSIRRTTLLNERPNITSNTYYISRILQAMYSKHSSSLEQLCLQHLASSLQFLRQIRKSRLKMPTQVTARKLQPISPLKKYTIVFDLDETLIHCHNMEKGPADAQLPIMFPDSTMLVVSINLRPYTRECIRQLSKNFEVIVFTASHQSYAKAVVEFLDPERKYISHYLSRQDCIKAPAGFYVKDLRVVDRDISKLLLVDNAAYSYCFQPQNGVPIIPFYNNKADFELKAIIPYLNQFLGDKDVRVRNNKIMRIGQYHKFHNPTDLVRSLYNSQPS